MGINVLNNAASQEVRLTTGSTNTIASGDLVVNTGSGNAFTASTALTIAQNNNTTAGTSAILPYALTNVQASGYGDNTTGQPGSNMVQLSTGNIVFAYSGNGTTATTNVNISFRNLLGGVPIAPISISDTSVVGIKIRKIGTTGFVVSWGGASNTLKFAIYNNDGTVVLSATTVASCGAANYAGNYGVEVTASNDIVFAYRKVTSNDLAFTRYNSSGTIQGTETVVSAASSATFIKILANAAGGFWVYWYRSVATIGWYFARYNSTGTLQGSVTTVNASTSGVWTYGGNPDNAITELSGGNVVVFYLDVSSYVNYAVYSSAGVVVKAGAQLPGASATLYALQSLVPAICLNGTGFAIFSKGTDSAGQFYAFDSAGVNLLPRTATAYTTWGGDSTSNGTQKRQIQLFNLGGAGFVVFLANGIYTSCVAQSPVTLLAFSATGATIGTPVALYAASSTSTLGTAYGVLTSDGSFAPTIQDQATQMGYGTYAIQRKSVIGVAQEAIAVNSTGRIATIGTFTTNGNYSTGGNFDNRTATVPGTRGTAAGTSAVLFGMS